MFFDSLVEAPSSGCIEVVYDPRSPSGTFFLCGDGNDTLVGRWKHTDSVFVYSDSSVTISWQGKVTYTAFDSDDDSMGVWVYAEVGGKEILADSMWGDYTVRTGTGHELFFTFTQVV